MIVRVPLDEGALTGRVGPGTEFPEGDFRNRYFRDDRLEQVGEHVDALVEDLGIEREELAEVALRYVLSRPEVSTVIPGMRSVRNVERNCALGDGEGLPPEQRAGAQGPPLGPQLLRLMGHLRHNTARWCCGVARPDPGDRRRARRDTGGVSATRGRIAGWGLALLALANAAIVVGLWWRGGGLQDIHDTGSLLTGLGRVSGLLGAYLALLGLLLIARLPLLDRLVGFDRLTAWHGLSRPRVHRAAGRRTPR